MRILFLCTGLEKQKDGIGDYTRKIGESIEKYGVKVLLLSFNDKFVEEKAVENEKTPIIRIPQNISWKVKEQIIGKILREFNPDWISIQFSVYGIQSKGIIFNMIPFFKRITKGYKVQVMMHELWIGLARESSLKDKIIGSIQKAGILKFIKEVKPTVVNTSINLYRLILQKNKISATILPLFSNIKVTDNDDTAWLWEVINKEIKEKITINNRNEFLIGGLFGSFYYKSWDLKSLITQLQREYEENGKKIIILSFGMLGEAINYWNTLKDTYRFINFIILGIQPEYKISQCIQAIDFGIVTTPVSHLGKSGSYVAMKEHGTLVLAKQFDISFNFQIDTAELMDNYVQQVREEKIVFKKRTLRQPSSQLENTTKLFFNNLKGLSE